MPPHDATALVASASAMGCAIDSTAAEGLLRFRELLVRWNRVHNLTAVRDPDEMWTQHLLDSLSIIAPMERELSMAAERAPRILDVGSGGGLPGAVLAIARPGWTVTSVDAVAKKAGFVRQAALELGLDRLESVHSRVEAMAPQAADVVVSRAFASLADFIALTRRHLAPAGVWAAMKGRRPDDELSALGADIDVFHVEPLAIPGLDAERHLIWMRPSESEPESAIRSTPAGDAPIPSPRPS